MAGFQQVTVDRELRLQSSAIETVYAWNKSGGSVVKGDVVVLDTTNSTASIIAFTTTTAADNVDVLGMALETIANNGWGRVQRGGLTDALKVNGTTDIAVGDEISTHTVAKIGAKATAGKGGAFATALEAYATNDSLGVIDAYLFIRPGVDSTAGGNTLDAAYDQGGAGSGRSITADTGAVAITVSDTSNNVALSLTQNDTTNNPSVIDLVNTGTGKDIDGHSSNWFVNPGGDAQFGYIVFAEDTLTTAVCQIGRDNTGDLTINAITGKKVLLSVADTDVVDVAGAAITLRQATTVSTGGLTVTAGGLTVSASGVTVTGDSTITGDLTVTGALTFGGNWTVGATLTVDELILDTDGSAPAATNCYWVRDNAGDLTGNAITGKQFIVAIAGTDEYTFSATILDMLANALDNCGYIILNAATAPAGTEVYLVNDNTGDLTLNALTGKDVIIAINGVDEVKFDDVAHVFNDAGNDRDFRIESNDRAYMFYIDGVKNAIQMGGNADNTATDFMVRIGHSAVTATAATIYADLYVASAAAVTIPAGTTSVVATVYLVEPDITNNGTITSAATLYIATAPTEGGTNNNAIHVAAGSTLLQALTTAGALTANAGIVVDTASDPVTIQMKGAAGGYNNDITDVNALEIISLQGVASAVNELTVTNAATTASVDIGVSGGDTNITLGFTTKGTGQFDFVAGTAGTAAAPEIILQGDINSGLYQPAADKFAVSIAGTRVQAWASGNMLLNDETADANTGAGVFILVNAGTAPTGSQTDGVVLYAADVAASSELRVRDEAGNDTVLSPHNEAGDYVIDSYSSLKDKTLRVNLEKLLDRLALRFPQDFADCIERAPGLASGHIR